MRSELQQAAGDAAIAADPDGGAGTFVPGTRRRVVTVNKAPNLSRDRWMFDATAGQ